MTSDAAVSGSSATGEFILAKNPNQYSKLPFLLCLPLRDGPLWLKAKADWPREARVFCQRLETTPAHVEVLERVGVELCAQRGVAIDLVLRRSVNRRSQFIFTTSNGGTRVFWQTQKTANASRPGLRVPTARAGAVPVIYIDTRERYGYRFSGYAARIEHKALHAGDYAAVSAERVIAVVERKSIGDFKTSIADGSLMFVMAELSGAPAAAVVVEGCYSAVLRHPFSALGFLADVLVRLQTRYPNVSVNFLETKKLAEDWTYRFLHTAYDNAMMLF